MSSRERVTSDQVRFDRCRRCSFRRFWIASFFEAVFALSALFRCGLTMSSKS